MRLSRLDINDLNEDQQAVLDAINSGPRGANVGLVGPFGVWVRAPRVGHAVQALGAAARFHTSLDEASKEVAICTVGAHYRAKFEFAVHKALAIRAGVDEAALDAIHQGERPRFDDDDHEICYQLAAQLLSSHRITDETYERAVDRFGEEVVIELVCIVGYYCLVSLTLNAFNIPVTERMTDPFPDEL